MIENILRVLAAILGIPLFGLIWIALGMLFSIDSYESTGSVMLMFVVLASYAGYVYMLMFGKTKEQ